MDKEFAIMKSENMNNEQTIENPEVVELSTHEVVEVIEVIND